MAILTKPNGAPAERADPGDAGDASSAPAASEPTERLWQAAGEAVSLAEFYASALRVLSERFDAPYAAITAQRKSDTIQKVVARNESARYWEKQVQALQLDARYRSTPVAKVVRLESLGMSFVVLATPVSIEGEGVVGAIGVVSRFVSRESAEARLGELKALGSLIGVLASQVGPKPREAQAASGGDAGDGAAQAAHYQSATEYAYSVTNGLKTKLQVAQASLAVVRGQQVELLCISGFDRVEKKSAGVRAIQQALCECVDIGEAIISQEQPGGDNAGYLLHKSWRSRCGGNAVASIPIKHDGQAIAVIGLQHRPGESFDPEHLEKVQEKLAPILLGLRLLRRSERSLVSHAFDAAARECRRFGQAGWRRAALVVAVAAIAAWAALAKQPYVLSAQAALQARDTRQVAAPFAGAIKACHVRPGDRVQAGEAIVEFDTSPLEAERNQALSQLEAANATLRLATAQGDLGVAATARADASSARSRLDATNDKLRRARIVAPAECVVLSGDVYPRVGESVPLGEPLLELASGDAKQVDVFVDESSAMLIARGQTVRFAAHARPSSPLVGVVARVDASSTIHNGKNAFRATIDLQGETPSWAIAGMEGVARVETARQPVWWVWCHRVVDAIRIQWWKL